MTERVTRYDGTCSTCGRTHGVTLTSELYAVMPPPTIALACQCRVPVTDVTATYVGSITQDEAANTAKAKPVEDLPGAQFASAGDDLLQRQLDEMTDRAKKRPNSFSAGDPLSD